MKPSLVRSTRLSGSVFCDAPWDRALFEAARETERLRFSALRFSSAARSASAFAAAAAAASASSASPASLDFWPSASVCRRSNRAFRRPDGSRRGVVLLRVGCFRSFKPAIHFARVAPSHASSCIRSSSPCVWRKRRRGICAFDPEPGRVYDLPARLILPPAERPAAPRSSHLVRGAFFGQLLWGGLPHVCEEGPRA